LPSECVTALIAGNNIPANDLQKSKDLAASNKLAWFQSNIGKSLALPFLRDENGEVFAFDGSAIIEVSRVCEDCKETFEGESDLCPWCSITEAHEYEAAIGNPFRMLERTGGLDDYFAVVNDIQKDAKQH
jgi:hypothetical protein